MRRLALILTLAATPATVLAAGVSAYLPLQIAPELERQVERALILAGRPVLKRPIAVAAVRDALPAICERDAALCESVRRHLRGYLQDDGTRDIGLGYLTITASATEDDRVALPNAHGMRADSGYEASTQLFWQPANGVLLSAGLLAYEDEVVPTGTMLSIGNEYAQLDLGFRDHWYSPLTASSMLVSSEAQTMPSVTLSNHSPLTRWGFRYEVFLAEMSATQRIAFGDRFTAGNPMLAGVHLSIEPFAGWSIGINRILQFGGGERSDSFRDLVDAFLRPSEFDNTANRADPNSEFGNQAASVTARYLSQGDIPFAAYVEYAGEDTSTNSNFRLGNAALAAGLQFPSVLGKLDLTVELSEWQNGWYVHSIYRDGLSHEGNVIGHWGGDQRLPGDGVGARSFMARVGWQPGFGGWLETTLRWLDNEDYTAPDYQRASFAALSYSRRWRERLFGAELEAGEDSLGTSFNRFSLFLRF